MDFQLNTKNLPPPPPPPSSSSSASSTMKRSFHGRKLQYQEKVLEQSILPQQTAILSPTYLTADRAWKTVATIVAHKAGHDQKRQEMELKNIGKVGMVKRKQFLQKRDISRSHEILVRIENIDFQDDFDDFVEHRVIKN
ncbi:unnamed protein product [Rotaria magnacalcarata]|uniref:Uncharacterized protein n=1 Tax=Rotaria magnacalcarata TaxID=392030 RepID=A0A819LEV4_9BILA|nr:unnamed protein product [Rotaria magnacalcarata]CAF4103281.1 unnamed protein product [Rotaria magnacalcarata]